MQNYGDTIRTARETRGWTQDELAAESGVPKRTIQEIENGRVSKPQRATDLKLRTALEIEGDPVRERSEWPDDVATIVDIVGAYMMTLTPAERIRWVSTFVRETVTGPSVEG
jgi:transcriptional regulator with XRE-family HTH domain